MSRWEYAMLQQTGVSPNVKITKKVFTRGGEDTEYIEADSPEYRHVLAQYIADFGNNGWELFEVDNLCYYFKRQL